MKKLVISILLLITLTLFCSCSETETHIQEVKDAPFIQSIYFESLLEKSEVIAEIKITDNLDETDNPSPKTFFQADVITVIKGDKNLETLKFMQGVNSGDTFEGYTVFEVGQKLVLFLSKAIG